MPRPRSGFVALVGIFGLAWLGRTLIDADEETVVGGLTNTVTAPTYGTITASISFDRSGTTRIGRFVVNHSFMLPGLVATAGSVAVGLVIARPF